MTKKLSLAVILYHLKRGKLTFIGKPLFIVLVTVELCIERCMDFLFASPFESKLVDENLTALIKTFERPRELKRLIDSIKYFYPEMKIIVVDDSKRPSYFKGVQIISMPYDCGVSVGRNIALKAVKTKYLLLLDDDFIFYRKTDLERAVGKMDLFSEIDIMGGEVINLPLYTSTNYKDASLHPTTNASLRAVGSKIGELAVYDKVANFYIGRTESIRCVGWDDRIKRLDHADFFTRAKGVLISVFNPEFKILHAQTPFNKDYMAKRNDYDEDKKLIYEKYYMTVG